jgi:hypothetical protein
VQQPLLCSSRLAPARRFRRLTRGNLRNWVRTVRLALHSSSGHPPCCGDLTGQHPNLNACQLIPQRANNPKITEESLVRFQFRMRTLTKEIGQLLFPSFDDPLLARLTIQ